MQPTFFNSRSPGKVGTTSTYDFVSRASKRLFCFGCVRHTVEGFQLISASAFLVLRKTICERLSTKLNR